MRKRGIKYLRRLVQTYMLFTKWKAVAIIEDKEIHIVWLSPKLVKDGDRTYAEVDMTMRTFERKDIPKRITSYREKIKREWAKRND